jgi:hypothetical protein
MALGNTVLVTSVIVLYCVAYTKSEGWSPTSSPDVSNYSRSNGISAHSSSGIRGYNNHRNATPSRRDMNSRAMQNTVTPAVSTVTANHRLQDATANSFYPSRRDWTKQAPEDDANSSIVATTQEYPGQRDYYPSRRERPQQKVEKTEVRDHALAVYKQTKQTNSVALSPRTNYTDWVTATCRRNVVPTFVDRGVSRGQCGGSPTVVNLSFLDRTSLLSTSKISKIIFIRK